MSIAGKDYHTNEQVVGYYTDLAAGCTEIGR
jgi:hypothetical protein